MRTPGPSAQRRRPRRPRVGASPSENRRCVGVELDADAAAEVARVEQRDADARPRRRRRSSASPIAFGSAYGAPPGAVVEVVELADGGDPGQRHLGERRPGQAEVAVRVERRRPRSYICSPPRPERAGAAAGCARAARGGRRGCGRWRSPGTSGPAAGPRRRAASDARASTPAMRSPSTSHDDVGARPASPPNHASSQW